MQTESEVYHDRVARQYDRTYQTPYWRLYHEVTWHNIERFLPKADGSYILDAGGGTGYWTIRLAKLGYRVALTDISARMLEVAKRKIAKESLQERIEVQRLDVRKMGVFDEGLFDLVLAEGDVLSYCEDEEEAVKELVRVTKPAGYIIASVDNRFAGLRYLIGEGKLNEMAQFLKDGRYAREFPMKWFTPDELKDLFQAHGLEVVRMIGKTVLPYKVNPRILRSDRNFRKLLELELKLCDEPCLLGRAGHLEIVGRKRKGGRNG